MLGVVETAARPVQREDGTYTSHLELGRDYVPGLLLLLRPVSNPNGRGGCSVGSYARTHAGQQAWVRPAAAARPHACPDAMVAYTHERAHGGPHARGCGRECTTAAVACTRARLPGRSYNGGVLHARREHGDLLARPHTVAVVAAMACTHGREDTDQLEHGLVQRPERGVQCKHGG